MPVKPSPAAARGGDLLVQHGVVHTLDTADTVAEAVAITGGRIVAIGSNRDVAAAAAPGAHVIDAGGRAVIPGLVDAHAHLDREGLKQRLPSLAGARSIDDIVAIINGIALHTAPGAWIVTMPVGRPPHYRDVLATIAEGRVPDRRDLDRAAPDHPVYIKPVWGYWPGDGPLVSVANSRALAIAGIDRDTRPPWDGIDIVKDDAGEPTGVFIERSMSSTVEHTLLRCAPQFSVTDRTDALAESQRRYHAYGTTSVFEGHGVADEVLAAYRRIYRSGGLSIRAQLMYSPSWGARTVDEMGDWLRGAGAPWRGHGVGDDHLRMAGVFVEEGRTIDADLRATALPHTGWAGLSPDCGVPRADLVTFLVFAARAGMRVCMIGSPAIAVMSQVHRVVPLDGLRWIVAHVTTLSEADIRAIRDMGLVLTMHTNAFLANRGGQILDAVGAGREDEIVPLAALAAAGVPFGLGTDNVPISMFHPIWHTVRRRERRQGRIIGANQRLSVTQAMRAATVGGAFASFEEHVKGTLEVGKFGDIAVLSADPWTAPIDELPAITADITAVGGTVVHGDDLP